MLKVTAHVALRGDAFSPFRAEQDTGLQFSEMNEPHEPGGAAAHRGEAASGGSARLDPPSRLHAGSGLQWLLKRLTTYVPTLRLHGATEIVLHVQLDHTGPSEFQLGVEPLRQLAELGVPLVIGCQAAGRGTGRGAG